ncbi:TPA: acyltransferase [Escherichia coli]|nr:acyltransferase [Escherichia coli]HAH8847043.1 acyltransferase [Escherichia coli]
MNKKLRIESIDYLRGVMALCVAIYHFNSWTINNADAGSVLGRLGIYAVSIFFIISGMSMYLAYSNFTWNASGLKRFLLKRYLRLFPAYFIACVFIVAFSWVISDDFHFSSRRFILNITFLFAFLKPNNYMPVGGWSIGCEVIFYILFPLIMVLKKKGVIISLVLSFGAFMYYSFFKLPDTPSEKSWEVYIQPLNHLFFFASGIAITAFSQYLKINHRMALLILACSVIFFCYYPSSDGLASITTGFNRLLLTALSIVLCLSVFHLNLKFKFDTILKFMGKISYGLYIFHGIFSEAFLSILDYTGIHSPGTRFYLLIFINLPIVIVFSSLFYNLVEMKFIRASKPEDKPSKLITV